MRIEVRPKTAEHAAQWRCVGIPDCPVHDQWHVVADVGDLNKEALEHGRGHGEDPWLHAIGDAP